MSEKLIRSQGCPNCAGGEFASSGENGSVQTTGPQPEGQSPQEPPTIEFGLQRELIDNLLVQEALDILQ